MVPSYNGWEDSPEDEREALEQWEARERGGRRSSRAIPRLDLGFDLLEGPATTP
jgi:hypothetical protein